MLTIKEILELAEEGAHLGLGEVSGFGHSDVEKTCENTLEEVQKLRKLGRKVGYAKALVLGVEHNGYLSTPDRNSSPSWRRRNHK